MTLLTTFIVAIGLSMDNFAVSLACGCLPEIKTKDVVKAGAIFALAHAIMFSIGWLGGALAADYIHSVDHWIAFLLLAFIGGKMVKESFSGESETANILEGGAKIILVSIATSLDALAVGVSLSIAGVNFLFAMVSMCACVFITTFLGFKLGGRLSVKFGKRAEVFGGIVLICIGVKILLDGIR